jgi:cytoskeletal protein CcmA (bactofilin family)
MNRRPACRRAAIARDGPKTESVISAGLTIEGKIEGAGHVRIAVTSRATSRSRAM